MCDPSVQTSVAGLTTRAPVSQIFHVLTAIIERLGAEVQPFAAGFLQLLPSVWQQAEGQPMVRMQAS